MKQIYIASCYHAGAADTVSYSGNTYTLTRGAWYDTPEDLRTWLHAKLSTHGFVVAFSTTTGKYSFIKTGSWSLTATAELADHLGWPAATITRASTLGTVRGWWRGYLRTRWGTMERRHSADVAAEYGRLRLSSTSIRTDRMQIWCRLSTSSLTVRQDAAAIEAAVPDWQDGRICAVTDAETITGVMVDGWTPQLDLLGADTWSMDLEVQRWPG